MNILVYLLLRYLKENLLIYRFLLNKLIDINIIMIAIINEMKDRNKDIDKNIIFLVLG